MNPLQERLSALVSGCALVVTFRGLSWVLALVFLGSGRLDRPRIHLPSLVRAILLVSVIGGDVISPSVIC